MSYIYEYDISAFAGKVNPFQLDDEINNSSISTNYNHTTVHGDTYNIMFDAELDEAGEITLDDIVAAHTDTNSELYAHISKLTPSVKCVTTTSNQRIESFTYAGTIHADIITKILVNAYMSGGITDFSVTVIDATNAKIIATNTFTNTDENSVVDVGTLSNIPTQQAIIEFLVKKNGGADEDEVCIQNISVYYE